MPTPKAPPARQQPRQGGLRADGVNTGEPPRARSPHPPPRPPPPRPPVVPISAGPGARAPARGAGARGDGGGRGRGVGVRPGVRSYGVTGKGNGLVTFPHPRDGRRPRGKGLRETLGALGGPSGPLSPAEMGWGAVRSPWGSERPRPLAPRAAPGPAAQGRWPRANDGSGQEGGCSSLFAGRAGGVLGRAAPASRDGVSAPGQAAVDGRTPLRGRTRAPQLECSPAPRPPPPPHPPHRRPATWGRKRRPVSPPARSSRLAAPPSPTAASPVAPGDGPHFHPTSASPPPPVGPQPPPGALPPLSRAGSPPAAAAAAAAAATPVPGHACCCRRSPAFCRPRRAAPQDIEGAGL